MEKCVGHKEKFGEVRSSTTHSYGRTQEGAETSSERMGVTNSKNIQFQDPSIHTKQFSQSEDGDSAFLRNVKGKGVPLRAKRLQKGGRAIAQPILDQGATKRWVVSAMHRPL